MFSDMIVDMSWGDTLALHVALRVVFSPPVARQIRFLLVRVFFGLPP